MTQLTDLEQLSSYKQHDNTPSPVIFLSVQSDRESQWKQQHGGGALGGPHDGISVGQWGAGLFDCFDVCVPNCLMAFICTAVPIAQSVAHIGMMSYARASPIFGTLEAFCWLTTLIPGGYCISSYWHGDLNTCAPDFQMVCTIIGFVAWTIFAIGAAIVRYRIRQRYQIPGTALADSLSSCFCRCCVVAQIASHTKSYQPGSCSFAAPDHLPGYAS